MSAASTATRVETADFDRSGGTGVAAEVRRVVAAAAAEDGASALDEAATLTLRHHGLDGSTLWVAGEGDRVDGFAWLHDEAVEVVVDPPARGRGVGRLLATTAAETPGPLSAWSHGDHPAAAALAGTLGFDRVRDLWVMRRPLSDLPPLPDDAGASSVRTFRVGEDEEAWLALNAEAFAHHPEQGATTRADLDERIAEPWFDAGGFFLAEDADGGLLGFHWTKVHDDEQPPYGEVYVVGVSPRAQGSGLGRLLTLTGLHHLAGRGLSEVVLFVESDNAPAVAVYSRLGFTHAPADTHVRYARADRA